MEVVGRLPSAVNDKERGLGASGIHISGSGGVGKGGGRSRTPRALDLAQWIYDTDYKERNSRSCAYAKLN
jgi:hypothetical protein